MSKEKEKKIKYCVFCGADLEGSKTYCPNCGKLIIKIDTEKRISKPKSIPIPKVDFSRKCPNCGSIITSTIIDQCPICNTALEKISEVKKAKIQKKPGLIFTNKKLEPEQKFVLKKDTWNLKEGLNVFGTCIYVLIIVFFLLITFTFQIDSTGTIQQILLSQIPELLFGLYPIWYIYNKKHSFTKLGFYSNSKKITVAILIGIVGSLMLLLLDFFSDFLINFMSDVGLDFFNVRIELERQNLVIRSSELIWIILLGITLCARVISSEIVFRGVLHNTLKQKFRNNYIVILIVSLTYSTVMLMFSFPYGISLFLLNFLAFTILGFLYEINRNIYNTMFASILYNILLLILISL